GIGLVLTGITGLLIPAPNKQQPNLKNLAGILTTPESPTLSISGGQNAARPYEPVARVYGRHRVFPAYGAQPFTEILGADQYLRMIFVVGLGITDIEDIKLGETPITNFQGVEMEVRAGWPTEPPLTLYTQDVFEDSVGSVLLFNVAQVRTSRDDAVE